MDTDPHFARAASLSASVQMRFDLRLLGAPALLAAGRAVDAGSRKALAILAWVALVGPSTRAKLATLLWPDLDAASARRNLRRELHRLRTAGAAEVLQGHADELTLAPGVSVDVRAFEAAAVTGDAGQAVALYAGPLLDGFDVACGGDFEPWAHAERDRLARLHRQALLDLAETGETAGDLRAALSVRLRLIEHDALHEQHYREAMRLHALLGERESALRLYGTCTLRLQRELGLQPMLETVALAQAIRARPEEMATRVLARADAKPVQQPEPGADASSHPPLVGRSAMLDPLAQALGLAVPAAGAGLMPERRELWLLGEGGIGKTRLAQALAVRATALRSGEPVWVQALAGDAHSPFATLLRALAQRWQPAVALGWPTWVRQELSRLLPDRFEADIPPQSPVDAARQRAALAAAWLSLQPARPVLTVFEDWHLADAATRELWAPGRMPGPVPAVVTLRLAEADNPLQDAVQDARRSGGCAVHTVPPLDAAAVAQLAQAVTGMALAPADAARWRLATGGNAFFLVEALRMATPAPWPADAALPVAPTVQDAVLARLQRLSPATQRLLQSACLAADGFDADDLAEASGLSEAERVDAVEQALAHDMLQRLAGDRLAFRHRLIADALAGSLSPERQRLLHARLAATLERRGGAPGRVARHLIAAGRPADAQRWTLVAVQAAERVGAHDQALTGLEQALALVEPIQGANAAVDLHLHRVRVLQRAARVEAADRALEDAEQAALRTGDGAQVRRALLARADHLVCSSRIDAGAALIQGLLAEGPDESAAADDPAAQDERVQALEVLADVHARRGQTAEAQAILRSALQQLPQGISPLRARLQLALGRCALYLGEFQAAAATHERAARLYALLGQADGVARATFMQGAAEMHAGRLDNALRLLERARVLAAEAGHVPVQRGAILNLVKLLTQTGDVARARELMQQGEALSPVYESAVAEAAFLQSRYYCDLLGGELEAAHALVPRVLATGDACGEPYWAAGARQLVADLLLLTGEGERARHLLGEAAAMCKQADGLMRPVVEVKRAWCELLQGESAAARERLMALGALDATQPLEARDTRRHVEAGIALVLGDAAQALACVPAPAAASTEEAKALQWAMRVQAEARCDGVSPSTRQAIGSLLDSPCAPPLEAAVLQRALSAAQSSAAPVVLR